MCHIRFGVLGLFALWTSGCTTSASRPAYSRAPTATVQARGETEAVATANADAADDPAIWRNPANPAASLIVGTDKRAGLYVYDLTGRQRSFVNAGRVNNVDLRDMGAAGIIVAASDRNDPLNAMLALFRLDPATATLTSIGRSQPVPGRLMECACTARVTRCSPSTSSRTAPSGSLR
jgi:3-phytase